MSDDARGRRPRDRYGRPKPQGTPDELEDFASASPTPEEAMELFDQERFFEAHELFEALWKSPRTAPEDRRFWKGVTQVAVGLCHCQRGNARGAAALLDRAAQHLAGYPSRHHGVDTPALVETARSASNGIRLRGTAGLPEFPRFPRSR